MSIAAKQIFLKSIEKEIADKVTAADSAAIMNCIYSELHRYDMEITIQETREDKTDDLLQAFIDAKNIEGRSEKTIEHYKYVIQKMLSSVNVPTYQVSIYNLRSYMMQERNRGVSDRTLATSLIDKGMSIQEVASILGHDNINTTMTYVYINKSNVKNAYRKYA